MKNKTFTLVELLVVVAILAILAGGALIIYDGVGKKAAKGQARNTMALLERTLKNYQQSKGLFPTDFDTLLKTSNLNFHTSTSSSYGENTPSRAALFSSSTSRDADGEYEIISTAIANFSLVSVLSKELKDLLFVGGLSQNMVEQLVKVGIRSIRYVEVEADHSNPVAQDIKLVDATGLKKKNSPTKPKMEKSENCLNAAQFFEPPTISENLIFYDNLGRGFRFFIAKDGKNLNEALNLPQYTPVSFAVLKPGIGGINLSRLGGQISDVVVALGIGNNCTLVNTDTISSNVNKVDTATGINSAPQYGAAKNSIYSRYIALFKVAEFLTQSGKPASSFISNTGFFTGDKNFSRATIYVENLTPGLRILENGAQFIGIIDCYGNSTDDIINQYNQSNK